MINLPPKAVKKWPRAALRKYDLQKAYVAENVSGKHAETVRQLKV